jgi:hypothetical protein
MYAKVCEKGIQKFCRYTSKEDNQLGDLGEARSVTDIRSLRTRSLAFAVF